MKVSTKYSNKLRFEQLNLELVTSNQADSDTRYSGFNYPFCQEKSKQDSLLAACLSECPHHELCPSLPTPFPATLSTPNPLPSPLHLFLTLYLPSYPSPPFSPHYLPTLSSPLPTLLYLNPLPAPLTLLLPYPSSLLSHLTSPFPPSFPMPYPPYPLPTHFLLPSCPTLSYPHLLPIHTPHTSTPPNPYPILKPTIASEVKGTSQTKPRLGQGATGIK